MAVKMMIYGLSNTGKTTLLSSLKDALVLSFDGKKFPLAMPHVNIPEFEDIDDYITIVEDAIEKYTAKFSHPPKTLAIDTLSSVVFHIYDMCNRVYSNFNIYKENNARLNTIRKFLEYLSDRHNVIILSHCILDEESGKMSEPISGKQFKSVGGFLASMDYTCYVSFNKRKREIFLRNHELARSLLPATDYPDTMEINSFNLQEYLEAIENKVSEVEDWNLG